jgi:putative ATP-dependent endonuclease of the OLD family
MFLTKFSIKNFQGIVYNEIIFNQHETSFLCDENMYDADTIADAIRICLSYGKEQNDYGISNFDFYIDQHLINESLRNAEFHLHFHLDLVEETIWFNDLLAVDKNGRQELQLHFRFFQNDEGEMQYHVWGGTKKNKEIAPEILYLVYQAHLEELREVEEQIGSLV